MWSVFTISSSWRVREISLYVYDNIFHITFSMFNNQTKLNTKIPHLMV